MGKQGKLEVLAGMIEEMREDVDMEQGEQRSRQLVECMDDTVEEIADKMSMVSRMVGNVQLGKVQGGLDQHALHQMGQTWQQQAAKLAGAVDWGR